MGAAQGEFRSFACRVKGVRAVAARSERSFPRHMHDEYGLGLVIRGAQKSLSGRGMVEAGAGDMITCNPGEVHDGVPIGGSRSWAMLYLDPEHVAAAVIDICEGSGGGFEFELPRLRSSRTSAQFRRLFGLITGDDEPAVDSEEMLLALLAELIVPRGSDPTVAPHAVLRVRERIDDAPALAPGLYALAAEAKLSRFQLLRAFRKETGLTPHAYIVQRRLHLARQLIGSGMPLAEAAADAGFSDQSHMTRLFARFYGLPPSRFSPAAGALLQ